MTARLWFPQLDVYDTIRRIGCLLNNWSSSSIGLERLYILDFFLANAPLLHRTYMPQDVRADFAALRLPKPEQTFLSYPSAPLLFHKMEGIQKEAIQTMLGKGLIDGEKMTRGDVSASMAGTVIFAEQISKLITQAEIPVLRFLVSRYGKIGEGDIEALRKSCALRRVT
jgi:hypothetical protein